MATVSVVDNKIRVVPGVGEVNIVINIIQKTLDAFNIIQDVAISTSSPISTTTDSTVLPDGVYLVSLSVYSPANKIVFITSQIEEQRALYQIDTIKTKDYVGQKDYRIYYDLFAFSIRYDELITAIAVYNLVSTIPFASPELIGYFNSIFKYFKYDID